ncbi:MAG TPA: hypothetical protein DEG71_02815, partial [Clostridiales bacterium]|nr:hypothetical protein [Clostridiales bacterium]
SSLSDEYDNGKISIDKYISSLETLRKQGGLTAEQLKNINDTIEDLSKTQQEAIQKANDDALSLYEDVNSQITDLLKKKYELEADAEEKAYNDRKDKLDKSLDDYKDYIDGVLDELDRVNATEDYNAKVSESSTKINTIDAEINKYSSAALSGDLEAINKIAELQKEKDEELKSLKEIQTDRERDLVKQTYQDNLNSYEKYVDGQQDLNDTAYDKFKEDLTLKTTDTALAMEAQNLLAQQNIGDVQNAIIALFTLTGENATVAGQLIQTQLIAKLQQAMDIQKNMNMISGGSSGNNPLGMNRSDFQTYLSNKKESESGNATPERLAQLRKENEELRKRYGIKGDIYSYSQLKGYYANGGINTETGIFALHGTPAKPEYILNTTQMNNLVKNLALNPIAMPKLNIPSLAGTGGMGSVNLGNINIYANSVDNNSVPKLVNEVMSKLKIEFNKLGVTRPQ